MSIILEQKTLFSAIPQIQFEGLESDNPLAFRWYDAGRVVAGKPMKDWLRFAGAYWHSFNGNGADPFGEPTHLFPWDTERDPIAAAKAKMDAAFEFLTKLSLPYYCFHDVDVVDYTNDVADNERRLQIMVAYAQEKQRETGLKLLWSTANLFSHRRYMNGAATNPDFHVLAHGAAQVKAAIDATIALGGENYVFWGGREGYMSLLNTNMQREQEHFATFLHTCKDYARRNGFTGTFFIEPKPMEPTKHQYDYDAATVTGFLRQYDLLGDFKLNLEVNHATLAGHTFQHELQVAADAGMLGSMDANRGDYQNGWDTDQFPNDIYELTEAMLWCSKPAACKAAASTSTPKSAATRPTSRTCSTPTWAAWTCLPAPSSRPITSCKSRITSSFGSSATPRSTAVPARPSSRANSPWSSSATTPPGMASPLPSVAAKSTWRTC